MDSKEREQDEQPTEPELSIEQLRTPVGFEAGGVPTEVGDWVPEQREGIYHFRLGEPRHSVNEERRTLIPPMHPPRKVLEPDEVLVEGDEAWEDDEVLDPTPLTVDDLMRLQPVETFDTSQLLVGGTVAHPVIGIKFFNEAQIVDSEVADRLDDAERDLHERIHEDAAMELSPLRPTQPRAETPFYLVGFGGTLEHPTEYIYRPTENLYKSEGDRPMADYPYSGEDVNALWLYQEMQREYGSKAVAAWEDGEPLFRGQGQLLDVIHSGVSYDRGKELAATLDIWQWQPQGEYTPTYRRVTDSDGKERTEVLIPSKVMKAAPTNRLSEVHCINFTYSQFACIVPKVPKDDVGEWEVTERHSLYSAADVQALWLYTRMAPPNPDMELRRDIMSGTVSAHEARKDYFRGEKLAQRVDIWLWQPADAATNPPNFLSDVTPTHPLQIPQEAIDAAPADRLSELELVVVTDTLNQGFACIVPKRVEEQGSDE